MPKILPLIDLPLAGPNRPAKLAPEPAAPFGYVRDPDPGVDYATPVPHGAPTTERTS